MRDIHYNNCKTGVLQKARVFSGSFPEIGYFSRTHTQGKEYEMVTRYVSYLIKKYDKLRNKRAAIFVEPQLDTGYPDIVVVEFSSVPTLSWKSARYGLTSTEIKILHYIHTIKNAGIETISNTLGFPVSSVEKSVRKLKESGLINVSKSGQYVRNIQLRKYCRINKIIAIEAKIDKWQEAIRQAENNTWFATESYILMNKKTCSPSIREQCESKGIGIIHVNGTIKTDLFSAKREFPVSYASLQFNEWVLRDINIAEEKL